MNNPATANPVAVVGAGRMGRGISLSFAFSGYKVNLFDSEERLGDFVKLLQHLSLLPEAK